MPKGPSITDEENRALLAELESAIERLGSQRAVGKVLGYPESRDSQNISQAIARRRVGRPMADLIYARLLHVTRDDFLRSLGMSAEIAPGSPPYVLPVDAQAVGVLAERTTRYRATQEPLERAIFGGRRWWREGMTPKQIEHVIERARTARGQLSGPLPEGVWFDFLVEECAREVRGEKVPPTVDPSDDLGGGRGESRRPKRRK